MPQFHFLLVLLDRVAIKRVEQMVAILGLIAQVLVHLVLVRRVDKVLLA